MITRRNIELDNYRDALELLALFAYEKQLYARHLYFSDLVDLFLEVQERYRPMKEEVFLRPDVFWHKGGDCDNQCIFMIAKLLSINTNPNSIWVVETIPPGAKNYQHVMIRLYDRYLDPFPGNPYGLTTDYKEKKEHRFLDLLRKTRNKNFDITAKNVSLNDIDKYYA